MQAFEDDVPHGAGEIHARHLFGLRERVSLQLERDEDRAVSDAGVGPMRQSEAVTPGEFRVLEYLVGSSLPQKLIADRLHVSPKTINAQVDAIFRKFGVASRLELIMRFLGRE